MQNTKLKKAICLLLILLAVLSLFAGCGKKDEIPEDDGTDTQEFYPGISDLDYEPKSIGDNVFTLCFDSTQSMNPITGTNTYNMLAAQLMYEPLLSVTSTREFNYILCTDYTTEDGITFDFHVRHGVKFHDGTTLLAADVLYTYQEAIQSSKYASRFSDIEGFGTPDEYTFRIVLKKANYDFPYLMDIPIIKLNSIEEVVPQGTGPYEYSHINETYSKLTAFSDYRSFADLPISLIMLHSIEYGEVNMAFSYSEVDLLQYDPTSDNAFSIQADHELLYYETPILDYIGFNTHSTAGSNDAIRRAVSYAVDRDAIISEAYDGHAVAATTPFGTACSYYGDALRYSNEYSLQKLSTTLNGIGMDDVDGDSFLEYYVDGTEHELTLHIIVNEESSARVKAAEMISYTLGTMGVNVTLDVLPWDDFLEHLQVGTYDMYLAETRLTADYDLSNLLLPGGSMNYGAISDPAYETLIDSFLAAPTAERKENAAAALTAKISSSAHIIPILFKDHVVAVHRNSVKGLRANDSYLFCNLDTWEIKIGS